MMSYDIQIGASYICKQDGREVTVLDYSGGWVVVMATVSGRRTHILPGQFTLRYRRANANA